jgi:hypothetical protein
MNENENNFESLRRLLALKRHETPPPGYFDHFSGTVMARIRAGEGGAAERQESGLSWLSRMLAAFEAKPAFAGAFAFSLCLFLVFGIVYAERPDVLPQPMLQSQQDSSPLAYATTPGGLNSLPAEQPVAVAISSSTNPVFSSQSAGPWFASQGAAVQPVNFILPGN